ncbi:DNA methyltransferase [Nereida sp. MMG025]|uniref:class I SAM-dependent DNA methyltransferase n=1 Tax=Nereida sp. MMG025 TaxID=2909981 RepID=UPI001F3FC188|nr:DNA methyltransferase [Nereida sp. MMG025]MCF6443696.1 class I SAM-dependent DNA methyltransferase [Nereida sp. MMG025]
MSEISSFIEKWKVSGGSERANYQMFLSELTEVLGVPKPLPVTDTNENDHYRFERGVKSGIAGDQSSKFIDLYKKGSFILETKQGTQKRSGETDQLTLPDMPKVTRTGHGVRGTRAWDKMMDKARAQADGYARLIARDDGWPPFLIVCDVGYVIEVYSDFSGQGHGYTQFPDGNSFRIFIDDLADEKIQDRLRAIWTDPQSLDPSKTAARVTREISEQLARLGKSFEASGHAPDKVAAFLMRCLFSMFAEDVDLIQRESFTNLLIEMQASPEHVAPALESLWRDMNTGAKFSPILKAKVLKFNGGLFADAEALPLDSAQIALLIGAARKDWQFVEPAIFGTLLERALDKRQRHKLGAHYTPRAYVERLVVPTIIEPLRKDWEAARTSAYTLAKDGQTHQALDKVRRFHRKLVDTRVLDPACGSGNFLYVALELMKRLEGEVTALLDELGDDEINPAMAGFTVDPHNFLGIELNPWAARVAELVLWIGYLQWHFRTYGKAAPAEPVLKDFHNIENRDAVLTYGAKSPRMAEDGTPVTRWDGITTKTHPVTGEQVPDETARVQVYDYTKPTAAKWPEADFIVGNPPFIGASRMRDALGDGYAEALWAAYKKMPQSADFVMFWWEKAALAARGYAAKTGKGTRRFGFITTNSLRQTFNRRVLEPHLSDTKKPLSLIYAIPDHPWVDAAQGAAVRIAMTVAQLGRHEGRLLTIADEVKGETEDEGRVVHFDMEVGKVFANLRTGADVGGAKALKANEGLSHRGVTLGGQGFLLTSSEARTFLSGSDKKLVFPYQNGRDLISGVSYRFVIDAFGYSPEKLRSVYPRSYQQLLDHVKPEREQNNRKSYRDNWWVFAEARSEFRNAKKGLTRFIATTRTAKYRNFVFVESATVTESAIVNLALEMASSLAVVSSRHHILWSLAAGGWLGVGNDPVYNNSKCFNTFPFPDPNDTQKETLRALGEELDAHRKERQKQHPTLTLTQMYNVLEKRRAGEPIEGRDLEIYNDGLIGILHDIHDRIDAAVADAYGWPTDLTDDEILHRLVDLNTERAREEAAGHIRWLRPDYQNPTGAQAASKDQKEMDMGVADTADKPAWPKDMMDQVAAIRDALSDLDTATPAQVARSFKRGRAATVEHLLTSMVDLGLAAPAGDGAYRVAR